MSLEVTVGRSVAPCLVGPKTCANHERKSAMPRMPHFHTKNEILRAKPHEILKVDSPRSHYQGEPKLATHALPNM